MLSQDQRRFVNAYLTAGRAEQVQGQQEILQQLAGLAPPPGATDAEREMIRNRIAAARSLLDDQATNPELKQAKIELDAASGLVRAAEARLGQEAKERREQGAAMLERARELAAAIDADASATDQKTATDAVGTIEGLTSGAPSAKDITDAQDAFGQLGSAIKAAAEAGAQIRQQRATRATEISVSAADGAKTIDADATDSDRESVAIAQGGVTKMLTEPVSADSLSKAETALLKLNETLAAIGLRCETDRKRRQDARTTLIDKIKPWLSVPKATDTENQDLASLAKSIAELAATPSDLQLEAADAVATTQNEKHAALKLLVEGREVRFDKAAELAKRVQVEAPSLKLHDRAPDDVALQEDIETQRQSATKYADWAQITTWDDDALVSFEQAIEALEKRVTQLNTLTEERIKTVSEAEQRATDAITAASHRAFSQAQQAELLKAVKAETDQFASDIEQADSVAGALDTLAQQATGLSAALAGLARRLAAVPAPDDGKLSTREKAMLKTARDAALKALDEVTQA